MPGRLRRPLRILITTHYWRPHRGGIETVAYEQARRLAARGHAVTVVSSAVDGPDPEPPAGVTVHRVPAWNGAATRWGIPYPVFHPRLAALLWREIGRHDVVLAHGHVYMPSVLSVLMARARGVPVVLFQHNPFVRFRPPWGLVESLADRTLGALTLRLATRLLAQSRYTAAFVSTLLPQRRVHIIPVGVDTRRFRPVASVQKAALRQRLGLPGDAFIALTIRRLVYRNGLDVLLEAAAQLQALPDLHIVIGGRGPEADLLRQTVAARGLTSVHLAGAISDADLPAYYQAADAFVLPTRTGEGFGLVLVEAYASGVPVVAAGGGGQDEVVADGQTGLLVPAGDAAALAGAVARLYRCPATREQMARAALCRARQYDWDTLTDRLERFLTRVVADA